MQVIDENSVYSRALNYMSSERAKAIAWLFFPKALKSAALSDLNQ